MKLLVVLAIEFVMIGVFVALVAIVTFSVIYSWQSKKRRLVKNAFGSVPFTAIDEVKDGEIVKIKGAVWDGGERVVSPLSERSCVYYHVHVFHVEGLGRQRTWRTLFEEEVMADVILKVGNHYAVVEADSPIAHLMVDRMYTSGFLTAATANVKKYLKKYGYDVTNWIGFNKDIECREAVLTAGEEFAVAGRARWISAK